MLLQIFWRRRLINIEIGNIDINNRLSIVENNRLYRLLLTINVMKTLLAISC